MVVDAVVIDRELLSCDWLLLLLDAPLNDMAEEELASVAINREQNNKV